jgi:hypothetical protein
MEEASIAVLVNLVPTLVGIKPDSVHIPARSLPRIHARQFRDQRLFAGVRCGNDARGVVTRGGG